MMKLNILVLGDGGREHAFCWKLNQSKLCNKLYAAPGNGGTANCAINLKLKVSDLSLSQRSLIIKKLQFNKKQHPKCKTLSPTIYPYLIDDNEELKNLRSQKY